MRGQIGSSSQRRKESRTTYLPRRKEIWNCGHGNSNVQEEQEGHLHRSVCSAGPKENMWARVGSGLHSAVA